MKKTDSVKKIIIVILVILFIFAAMMKIITLTKTTELLQLGNSGHSQMMGYILKTENNKVIVIDGGTTEDTQNLINEINNISGKVDYWFITHPHQDHASCFIDIVENTQIPIGEVYVTLNTEEWYNQHGGSRKEEAIRFINTLKNEKLKSKVQEVTLNQIIQIDNIKCEILGIKNPEIVENAINNSSMIIKMDTLKNSILFLGDTGIESGNKLLEKQKEKLKSDIVQMAHHGQSGVTEEIYKAINPSICLWPTPNWLWINDSGNGEDSGPWKTKETKEWIQNLEIKRNIIEKDGNIKIQI